VFEGSRHTGRDTWRDGVAVISRANELGANVVDTNFVLVEGGRREGRARCRLGKV
jgi:hypothetical protein